MAATSEPKLACPARACVEPARLVDLVAIFNLIQLGAAEGHFNPIYLKPRYQAGLGLQLLGVLLASWMRVPGGIWRAARLQVLRVEGSFTGFALVLRIDAPPGANRRELYMCSIRPERRGVGWGRKLLLAMLESLPPGASVEADSLPAAVAMKRLLRGLGFRCLSRPMGPAGVQHFALERTRKA